MVKELSDTPGPRLPWAGKRVPAEQAEEELSRLWRMSADNVRTGQNINVRTSVLNLVICASDLATAQRASTVVRDLSSTHLARVILLILDDSASSPTNVSTWVTLRSFSVISDIMRHNFEQITIMASGTAIRSTAHIIQPLLKPELPVYLWWLNDPSNDSTLFGSLVNLSSRVIVDSSSFFTPEQSIPTLSSLMQASPNCAFSDLNWGRITPWRQLVAQFFDVVEYKSYLVGVNHIEVEHAAAPLAGHIRTEQGDVSPNPTCALLLAAWLKTSLGWRLTEGSKHNSATGTYSWIMARTTSPLVTRAATSTKASKTSSLSHGAIHVRPRVQSNMSPGSLCLVRLISKTEGKHIVFTINREDDPDHVLTSVELPEETRPQRTVSMAATRKVSELLHDEMEIMGRDHLYEQTLQEVAQLLIDEQT